ncbi:hypothetical protein ABZ990_06350 [Streptomyces sp. NPDC046203]|uniref:hypothetical protein n=1 Tax=Streptomyces sp. NPDC046203 TaxID=3154602 RepID=UPI00340D091C
MKRTLLAVTAAAALAAFAFPSTDLTAAAQDCLPGSPPTHVGEPRTCLWDGGSAGSGYPDEETCAPAAERYAEQDEEHDYQCEDVFGNGSWWVVRY